MLPDNVHYVFLSATIPNALQFAQWICNVHKQVRGQSRWRGFFKSRNAQLTASHSLLQPCHVVYTDYRPTPLRHFVFPAGGSGMYLCVDEKGTFVFPSLNSFLAPFIPFPLAHTDGHLHHQSGNLQEFFGRIPF